MSERKVSSEISISAPNLHCLYSKVNGFWKFELMCPDEERVSQVIKNISNLIEVIENGQVHNAKNKSRPSSK
jgi:hypothetical protein